eukprot:758837-Hanusia_phi.AAC.1
MQQGGRDDALSSTRVRGYMMCSKAQRERRDPGSQGRVEPGWRHHPNAPIGRSRTYSPPPSASQWK